MSKIDFQPMPKRFMVWDKESQKFSKVFEGFWQVAMLADRSPLDNKRYVVLQSTNLFDKDGKEIFEGGLVENEIGWRGIITTFKGQWIVSYDDGPGRCSHLLYDICRDLKLIGHALSNPELLRKKEEY